MLDRPRAPPAREAFPAWRRTTVARPAPRRDGPGPWRPPLGGLHPPGRPGLRPHIRLL